MTWALFDEVAGENMPIMVIQRANPKQRLVLDPSSPVFDKNG